MIKFNNLYKQYSTKNNGVVKALDGFSLEINDNQIFALVGINGAGKTTALKALLGMIQLDDGFVTFDNNDKSYVNVVGFASEIPDLPDFLTVEEILACSCRLAGCKAEPDYINRAVMMFDLETIRTKTINVLSKGNRQRVSLAAAVVYNADTIVLDEPASGLDPLGRRLIKKAIKQLKAEGKTILFSTHMLADLPEICDKMAIVHEGKIIFEGRVSDFCKETSLEAMETEFAKMIEQETKRC